jgi:hypothetical protein
LNTPPGIAPLAVAVAVTAMMLAVSCAAPVHWRKPGAGPEDWSRDKAACQSRAHKEAERRYRLRSSEVRTPSYEAGHTLKRSMAIHDSKKTERRLFESCLKGRGYSPGAEAPKKG